MIGVPSSSNSGCRSTRTPSWNALQNGRTPRRSSWKITDEDWRNRDKWDQYEDAVNEMLQKTSTDVCTLAYSGIRRQKICPDQSIEDCHCRTGKGSGIGKESRERKHRLVKRRCFYM